ncbi:hypothetical protein [Limosilactobacillus antri]|uniref:hypothetical protein n=1 Tax=Limosilactobacillus antri TaxID=227943 RepID=UPI001F5AB621|nr:hypothetical protein [Limosilactobacillus antri]
MKWFVNVLTAMFVGAKLCGVITWSWWLVFSPFLICIGWYALLLTLAAIIGVIAAFMDDK